VDSIWIARDLGYRGGRRTGLPLTDEVHLPTFSHVFGGLKVHRATIGPPVAERTAAIVWRMLRCISVPVFLWNVFPFHPYLPGEPLSNRCHSAVSGGRARRFSRISWTGFSRVASSPSAGTLIGLSQTLDARTATMFVIPAMVVKTPLLQALLNC